jgi:hypothetical protein
MGRCISDEQIFTWGGVLEQSFCYIFKLDLFWNYPIFVPCLTNIIPVYLIYGTIF